MSNRGKTLVKGHALQAEGQPTVWSKRFAYWCVDTRQGTPHCQCGATPGPMSANAAKRWHREHKDEVRTRLSVARHEEDA